MKRHLANAAYGVIDYLAVPLGMLIVAPVVLHRLGAAPYGLWTLVTSVVTIGSVAASGFGDANIQRVSRWLEQDDPVAIRRTVRNTLSIHLVLGSLLATILLAFAGTAAARFTLVTPELNHQCFLSLCLAALIVLARALETVCVSTQRAFLRYSASIRISLCARVLTLVVAAFLSILHASIVSIVAATALITAIGTAWQFYELARLMHVRWITPAFHPDILKDLFRFGIYSWLQAVSAVIFVQIDRIFLGMHLGMQAVAAYALCLQLTQPLYGIAAAGLHFLFPHFASGAGTRLDQGRQVLIATLGNVVLVTIGAGILVTLGLPLLRIWASGAIAEASAGVLPLAVISTAFAGMGVTATYTLLAHDHSRTVMLFNVIGGAISVCLMPYLLSRFGIVGLAAARLPYGVANLLLYLPLFSVLTARNLPVAAYEEVR
ncbi:oligosaccharide flippase family protein [Terriglobus sp. 2YAB30_2]|uniref:oligosaccharide flippase family protein n=1 Tax=unclassified Terriglobus TaxID=2628988 RepID=UPI003F9AFED5